MSETWGPEIVVNGNRPEWLTGKAVADVRTNAGWCYANETEDEHDEPAENWAWQHSDGKPCIIAIRFRPDHPIYQPKEGGHG